MVLIETNLKTSSSTWITFSTMNFCRFWPVFQNIVWNKGSGCSSTEWQWWWHFLAYLLELSRCLFPSHFSSLSSFQFGPRLQLSLVSVTFAWLFSNLFSFYFVSDIFIKFAGFIDLCTEWKTFWRFGFQKLREEFYLGHQQLWHSTNSMKIYKIDQQEIKIIFLPVFVSDNLF